VRNQLVSRKAIEAYSSERYLLWPGRGRGAQKSCAFRQALEEFPLTIEVMIVNKYFGLTPDNIPESYSGRHQSWHTSCLTLLTAMVEHEW
jgi:hypothetical protein